MSRVAVLSKRDRVHAFVATGDMPDDRAQCIYAILFSNGVTKVGRTSDTRTRIDHHYYDAARFGVRVVHVWVSWPHSSAVSNELALMAFAHEHSRGVVAGNEYFRDCNYRAVVEYGRTLEGAVHEGRVFTNVNFNEPPEFSVVDTERLLTLADISHLTGIDIDYLVDIAAANWRSSRPLHLA